MPETRTRLPDLVPQTLNLPASQGWQQGPSLSLPLNPHACPPAGRLYVSTPRVKEITAPEGACGVWTTGC